MSKSFKYILFFLVVLFMIDRAGNQILLFGVDKFFGLNQQSEILIIGHSHVMLATDKDRMEKELKCKISKYTREGVNVFDRYQMVKQYMESSYTDSLKIVLYGVDEFIFAGEGLSANSYQLFYPFMDYPSIDKYVKMHAETKQDYYTHKLFKLSRYSDALINSAIRGWRNDYSNYKYGEIDAEAFRNKVTSGQSPFVRKIVMEDDLVNVFFETMNLLKSRGIRVILINTPTIDVLNEIDAEGYENVMNFFTTFAEKEDEVEFWDLNPPYSSDYSIFFDPIHLNPKGQQLITSEIIKRLDNKNAQCND